MRLSTISTINQLVLFIIIYKQIIKKTVLVNTTKIEKPTTSRYCSRAPTYLISQVITSKTVAIALYFFE